MLVLHAFESVGRAIHPYLIEIDMPRLRLVLYELLNNLVRSVLAVGARARGGLQRGRKGLGETARIRLLRPRELRLDD